MKYDKSYHDTLKSYPMLEQPVLWLLRNNHKPLEMVNAALIELESRGCHLPSQPRHAYAEKVIIGQFLALWLKKHSRRQCTATEYLRQLDVDPVLRFQELQPFRHAIVAAGDKRAFERWTPQMARVSMLEKSGLTIGKPEDFEVFATVHHMSFASLLLQNFDSSRPGASRTVIRYLQKTMVSSYLRRRTRPIREDVPNLRTYLRNSKMNERTRLAIKLAYLPELLDLYEKKVLEDKYQFNEGFHDLIPIQQIAHILRYPNPAVLSRKLYRVREWCRSSNRSQKGG